MSYEIHNVAGGKVLVMGTDGTIFEAVVHEVKVHYTLDGEDIQVTLTGAKPIMGPYTGLQRPVRHPMPTRAPD